MLTKDMVIEGTDYKYWKDQCKDFNDRHLMAGYRASGGFKGYFTLGEFRTLCIDGYRTQVEQNRRDAASTSARLTDGRSLSQSARFQELHKVTMAMMKEGPDGPITRATKDRRLTKNFVEGKSAEQIIDFCKGLYA